jgi:hypothetical protein
VNERFLDADLFISAYLEPLEPYREKVGTLIFEFSRFHTGDWEHGAQFVEALDGFAQAPKASLSFFPRRSPNQTFGIKGRFAHLHA